MPRKLIARLAIGLPSAASSNIWRFWIHKGQVYVSTSNLGGIEKLSFHSSGICRKAFTAEYGTPSGLDNRATDSWRRAETPPAGTSQAACGLQLHVPTDCLSTARVHSPSDFRWIEPAPSGSVTIVQLLFTKESESSVQRALGERLLTYWQLDHGEAVVIAKIYAQLKHDPFVVPASDQVSGYVFSDEDPKRTGRPVRFTRFSKPIDGQPIYIWEFGGYRSDHAKPELAKFTRMSVFARGGKQS